MIESLDHINIRTAHVFETIKFFRDILSMVVLPPPGRSDMEQLAWVYDKRGAAVIHIGDIQMPYPTDAGNPVQLAGGSGSIHHVAFNCSNFEMMKAKFAALEIESVENEVTKVGLRQIFVRDPNGILVELNFRSF